jgi:hypothetical protein
MRPHRRTLLTRITRTVGKFGKSHASAAFLEDRRPDAQSIGAHRLGATPRSALARQAARGRTWHTGNCDAAFYNWSCSQPLSSWRNTDTVPSLRPVRQVKVSRSERSSASEKCWKTATLSAAIRKSTITSFILQCVLPTRHIVLNTKLLSLTRLMTCLLRRTRMSSFYSMARISLSEHHAAEKSRRT